MCKSFQPLLFVVFCVSKSNEPLLVLEYFTLGSVLSFHTNPQNSEMNFHRVLLFPMCPDQIPKGLAMFQMCSQRCSQQYLIFLSHIFFIYENYKLGGPKGSTCVLLFWGMPNVSKDSSPQKKKKKKKKPRLELGLQYGFDSFLG